MAESPKMAGNGGPKPSAIRKPIKGPVFRIIPLEASTEWLKFLIYGDYGIGKTTLAGTAIDVPSMADVLLANAEAGTLSLLDKPAIDTVPVTTFKHISSLESYLSVHHRLWVAGDIDRLRELEAELKGVPAKSIKEPKHYRTCILDSLTEIDTLSMYQELGINENTRLDEDVLTPEWTEYKRNLQRISRTIRKFRDLPMHIIIICSASWDQDETKKKKFTPSLTGKLSGVVQGFMDLVGFLATGQDDEGGSVRKLYVTPTPQYAGKNRFPAFKGTYFENPTIGSILKAVNLDKASE